MFYVYVPCSEKHSGLYIGYSADLRHRVALHKQGNARATASRGPWELIHYEPYVEESDALGREGFFKSGSGRRFPRVERDRQDHGGVREFKLHREARGGSGNGAGVLFFREL